MFEIRNSFGDLILAIDSSDEASNWFKAYCENRMSGADFESDNCEYTVYTRDDDRFVSVGYVHRVWLGG